MTIKSHVINGLESYFFFSTLVLLSTTDSLAGKTQTSTNQGELLFRVNSCIESLLESSHSEFAVPISEVDMVLLNIREFVEHSTEEGGHTFMELLNFQLQNVLVRILNQSFADDFLVISHLFDHFLMSPFFLLAVLWIVFLDFVGWMKIGFIHMLQKVHQCVCRFLFVTFVQPRNGVSHILIIASLSRAQQIIPDFFISKSILQQIVCFPILHVPRRHFQSKLLEFQRVKNTLGKTSQNRNQFSIIRISFIKLPVSHSKIDLLAGNFATQFIDERKHCLKILSGAFTKIGGLNPYGSQLLPTTYLSNALENSIKASITDIKTIEDNLQGHHLRAALQGIFKIFQEVILHVLFDGGEVSITTTFE